MLKPCSKNADITTDSCLYTPNANFNSNITNNTAIVKGYLSGNGNKVIENSLLYITEKAEFGNLNKGGIQGSTLIVEGDATFGNFNKGGIQSSTIYIKGTATFQDSVVDINNSTICVGGNITGLSADGIHVFSWSKDKAAYNAAGCPSMDNGGSNSLTDLLHSIVQKIK